MDDAQRDLYAVVDRRIAQALGRHRPVSAIRGTVSRVDAATTLSAYLEGASTETPNIAYPRSLMPAVGQDILVLRREDGYLLAVAILSEVLVLRASSAELGSLDASGDVTAANFLTPVDDANHAVEVGAAGNAKVGSLTFRRRRDDDAAVVAEDDLGRIDFWGRSDGGSDMLAARLSVEAGDTPSGDMPGTLVIATTPVGGTTPVSRWVVMPNGDLVPASGQDLEIGTAADPLTAVRTEGVAFPATAVPSADVNTLDDYEEGTFTPAITFGTAGDLSVTYTTQTGYYTKVGRLVHIMITMITSALTHSTASGNFRVTGLPFTVGGNSHPLSWQGAKFPYNLPFEHLVPLAVNGTTYIEFNNCRYNNTAQVIDAADVTSGQAPTIRIAGVYQVS